jgi:ribokinase
MVGVGGIGSGMFFALRGNDTLGRNESRAGTIANRRDFCKLHIVAHYVAALGGGARGPLAVLPIGKVGDDPPGAAMVEHMRRAGMDTRFVTVEAGCATLFSVCFTYPDGDGGNITTDDSASSRLTDDDVERAVAALPEALGGDASGGIALAAAEVPLAARLRLLELARRRGWLTAAAVNAAEVPEATEIGLFRQVDLLGVNRGEAAAIAGRGEGEPVESIVSAAAARLAEGNPPVRLCVTAGAAGAVGWADGDIEFTPPPPVEAVNTAGAGDATLAALIVATAAGLPFIRPGRPRRKALADAPLATAMDLAALLAGLAVAAEDTINFDADADALRDLARSIGADATALEPALSWE